MILGLFMAAIGGPLLALMFGSDFSRRAFDKRRQLFLQTEKGKNPETEPFGPHKPFGRNLLLGGLFFFAIGMGVSLAVGI